MNHFKIVPSFLCLLTALSAQAITPPTPPQARVQTDLSATPVTGKTIIVPAGGDLQAAINSANLGDELVLQAGATWTGNYRLTAKTGTGWLTIRSSASNALPKPGTRVAPSDAPNMAKIQAAGSGTAFSIDARANHYRLIGLEITEQPKQALNYGLIMEGDPTDTNASDLPSYIIVDRCYVHGLTLSHVKFGMQLNGSYFAVIDSYFSEFHGLGQDTQALFGYMGTGPFKIVNNFLEGSGENILFGGASDAIPNTTSADVVITNNYFYKPQLWRTTSVIPPIPAPTASAGAGGTLTPGTYYYSVIVQGTCGTLTDPGSCQSARSGETAVTVTQGQNEVTLQWPAQSYGDSTDTRQADNYVVARSQDAPGSATRTWTYFLTTSPSLTDNGSLTALTGYSEWARYWTVKNLFEIKNGVRMFIDSNVFDGNWVSAQNGFAILLTPRNENPFMPGNRISDITFTNNIVRHVAGVFNIGSEDDSRSASEIQYLAPTSRVLIENNLFEDVNWNYGGNGWFFQDGPGSYPSLPGTQDLQFIHNTIFQNGSNAHLGSFATGPANELGPFLFRDNILSNGPYGWHIDGVGNDWATLLKQFSEIAVDHNVWVGIGSNPQYAGNYYPTDWQSVGFADYHDGSGGDYHLLLSSPYKGKASDGTDPGADIDLLTAMDKNSEAGVTPNGVSTPPPVTTPVAPPPVHAPSTVWFRIVNVNSGKCLAAQADGTVKQYTCKGSDTSQLFTLAPQLDSNKSFVGYEVQTYNRAVGLNVWGAKPTNGATVGLYTLSAAPNEVFTLHPTSAGHFAITPNLNPKQCLDMTKWSVVDGGTLQQWQCSGYNNQAWDLVITSLQ